MNLLETISGAWGWKGIVATEIVEINRFGNVIFIDDTERYWRICPEELTCQVVADTQQAFATLRVDEEFVVDWEMENLCREASIALGAPPTGICYCLKIPAVFGAAYTADNIGIISVSELIAVSGDLGRQIEDLPDGAEIRFNVVE